MTFINLQYVGPKNITDPYNNKDRWEIGQIRLTPADHARKLLVHPEFKKAADAPAGEAGADRALLEANMKLKLSEDLVKDEANQQDQVLITIDSMNREGLLEYAAKYQEPVNKKLGEVNLRLAVRNLVERYGVR